MTRPPHGGRGIAVVDVIAQSWGHSPSTGGGKVIWVVVAIGEDTAV